MNWKPVGIIGLGVLAILLGLSRGPDKKLAEPQDETPSSSSLRFTSDGIKLPSYLKGEPLPSFETGIKVTTWNLHWFPGHTMSQASEVSRKEHVRVVVDRLRELDSDILCLQEIKEPEALKEVVEALPEYRIQMVSNFKRNLEIAILSKSDSTAAFAQEFHPAESTPPRGFAFAAFDHGDKMLLIYSVHLKSNIGGIGATAPQREESAKQILAHAKKQKEHYRSQDLKPVVLVCGDFNSDPTRTEFHVDETLKRFVDAGFVWAFRGMAREDSITWLSDGSYPDAVFDGFLFLPSDAAMFSRSETLSSERSVSDHRPVSIWVRF